MRDLVSLKARYERDEPAVRLGGLASNLSRIAWCAQHAAKAEAASLFRESKYFTEWAAPACTLEVQGLLAELQVQLAVWERQWGKTLDALVVAQEAQGCASRLLASSGLLDQ